MRTYGLVPLVFVFLLVRVAAEDFSELSEHLLTELRALNLYVWTR